MKAKLVEFYELERDNKEKTLKASAHVYVEDLDMDIRGVDVVINEGKPWITLPVQMQFDVIERKMVTFPIIQFANRQKTLELRKCVQKCVSDYIYNVVIKSTKSKPSWKKKNPDAPRPKNSRRFIRREPGIKCVGVSD